nr:probably inactive leucine-rich repeat receptor-like protein kinase At5g48380 [Coffea arabica]
MYKQNSIIGIGKMGTMYKARLPNGWFLAIKGLFNSEQLHQKIASETITLGKLRHRRLVPLIGFCPEKEDLFLVYKYMSNGNLYNWLHGRKDEVDIMAHWALRVKVAAGIAEGLAWLHHKYHRPSMLQVHETLAAFAEIYNYTADCEMSY